MISRDAAETRAAGYQVPTYSEDLLAPGLAVLRDRLPHLDLIDMHVHVGLADPAGLLRPRRRRSRRTPSRAPTGSSSASRSRAGTASPTSGCSQLAHTSDGRITALARLD